MIYLKNQQSENLPDNTTGTELAIDFQKAVITSNNHGKTWSLVVSGTQYRSDIEVDLIPLVYTQQPDFWGIQVIGKLPEKSSTKALEPAHYSVSIPLNSILGKYGVEVIGASHSLQLPLAYKPLTLAPSHVQGERLPNLMPNAPVDALLTNGDFTITPNPGLSDSTLGDGKDENTTWSFDFSAVQILGFITKAELTLEITPAITSNINTDVIRIEGLPWIATDLIQTLTPGIIQEVTLDLLRFKGYTNETILSAIQNNTGRLHFRYGDDAIISRANLILEAVDLADSSTVPVSEGPI